jgi:hypothetical protein
VRALSAVVGCDDDRGGRDGGHGGGGGDGHPESDRTQPSAVSLKKPSRCERVALSLL